MQTAIIRRLPQDELAEPAHAPIGRWTKVLAFTVGLTVAIGGHVFVMPRLTAWRTWAATRLETPAASRTYGPSSAPTTAAPSLAAASPDRVQAEDQPLRKTVAHKVNRSKRRHQHRHRTASRR